MSKIGKLETTISCHYGVKGHCLDAPERNSKQKKAFQFLSVVANLTGSRPHGLQSEGWDRKWQEQCINLHTPIQPLKGKGHLYELIWKTQEKKQAVEVCDSIPSVEIKGRKMKKQWHMLSYKAQFTDMVSLTHESNSISSSYKDEEHFIQLT